MREVEGSASMQPQALVRFGVGMPAGLLAEFDRLIASRGYSSRSEAIRDLVRAELLGQAWKEGNGRVTGILSIVYDHEAGVGEELTSLQHAHHQVIVCTMHVHLDAHRCMEVVVLRGEAATVKGIADHLSSCRGVEYGKLVAAAMDAATC